MVFRPSFSLLIFLICPTTLLIPIISAFSISFRLLVPLPSTVSCMICNIASHQISNLSRSSFRNTTYISSFPLSFGGFFVAPFVGSIIFSLLFYSCDCCICSRISVSLSITSCFHAAPTFRSISSGPIYDSLSAFLLDYLLTPSNFLVEVHALPSVLFVLLLVFSVVSIFSPYSSHLLSR